MTEPANSPAKRRVWRAVPLHQWFWLALAATLVVMAVMNVIGVPLVTEAAPFGIVSFEFAGNADQTGRILASWDETARLYAAFSLGLDYLFMVVYGLALGLGTASGVKSLAVRGWPPGERAHWLSWFFPLAIFFDAGENALLFRQMVQGPGEMLAWGAAVLAAIKFGLIFLGLVFGFYALVVSLLVRQRE
jgi:hypothetical protein